MEKLKLDYLKTRPWVMKKLRKLVDRYERNLKKKKLLETQSLQTSNNYPASENEWPGAISKEDLERYQKMQQGNNQE